MQQRKKEKPTADAGKVKEGLAKIEEQHRLLLARNLAMSEKDLQVQTRVWIVVTILICVLTATIAISVNSAHNKMGEDSTGDTAFGAGLGDPFIDDNGVNNLNNVMQALTAGCTPPDDFVYSLFPSPPPGGLTLAQAQAIWLEIVAYLRPNASTPDEGCLFYGWSIAQRRSNLAIGPVDFCHGMMHGVMTAYQVKYDRLLPTNSIAGITQGINNAYPLNLLWRFMGISTSLLAIQLHTLLSVYSKFDNVTINIRDISTGFCNQYFASDQPTFYQSPAMPWLGFPFMGGTLQRKAHTTFGNNVVEQIGQINPVNFTTINKLYIFGDVLTNNPGAQLLIDTIFANITLDVAPGTEDIVDRFADLDYDINADLDPPVLTPTPVAVLGRYADDLPAYRSAIENPRAVFIMLTNNDPTNALQGIEPSLDILKFARSSEAISLLDFTTHFPFENTFGPDFIWENYVAKLLIQLAVPTIWLNMTTTSSIPCTYALANTIINGADFNGNLATRLANAERLQVRLRGTGFRDMSFKGQTYTTYTTFSAVDTAALPSKFSWRTQAAHCVPPVMNQGICGCCFAVAMADAASARFCTSGKTGAYAPMSGQQVTSCCGDAAKDGCVGDHPSLSAAFMADPGVITDECFPFQNADKKTEVPCQVNCKKGVASAGTTYQTTLSKTYKQIVGKESIKMDLKANGPMAVGFSVPPDFDNYFDAHPTGIYTMKASTGPGHLVSLYGWDDTTNPPSWECKNQWGKNFADQGWFRISQYAGANVPTLDYMIIENHAYTVTPYIARSATTNTVPQANPNDPNIIVDDEGDGNTDVIEDKPGKEPKPPKNSVMIIAPNATLIFWQFAVLTFLYLLISSREENRKLLIKDCLGAD